MSNSRRGLMIAILLATAAASRPIAAAADPLGFSMVAGPLSFKSVPGFFEERLNAQRGTSSFDRIGLHHFIGAGERPLDRPLVLYLPGTWMNGTAAPDDPRYSLALFMASHGVDFWALDYRTHFVPPTLVQSDLAELRGWTTALFEADVSAAVDYILARTARRRLVLAGFSWGANLAYLFAADHPAEVAGLLILDGYVSSGMSGAPPRGEYAEDIAGRHLTWAKRAALLRLVLANPRAPAPVPGYRDAADNLAHVVSGSAAFGGNAGLANPLGGFSRATVLAAVLITFDRYFPLVPDYEAALTPARRSALERSAIPVLAFSSTNIAPDWPTRMAKSAALTGSTDVTVKRLDRWGHLDIICGNFARRMVFRPALAWLRQHRR